MSKITRAMRLLADLSPEERNELLSEYKDTSGETSGEEPQDTLKETDKGGSTESEAQETETTPKNVEEVAPQEEEQNSKECEVEEPKSTTEPIEQEPSVQNGVEVGEQVGNSSQAVGRDINDFVTKDDLKALMESFQAKLTAQEQENKALKEELDKAKSETQGLKDKYEGDNFGDISQMFKTDKPQEEKITQSFSDYFGENFK